MLWIPAVFVRTLVSMTSLNSLRLQIEAMMNMSTDSMHSNHFALDFYQTITCVTVCCSCPKPTRPNDFRVRFESIDYWSR